MAALNWGVIQDGGTFESLMHAILYAEDQGIILFGRPGKDAGQDARSADGSVVYQAKYRQQLTMDGAIKVALEELKNIKEYRKSPHANNIHWQNVRRWILVANILANPNDDTEWKASVFPAFQNEGLTPDYWGIKTLAGKLAEQPHIRDVFFEGENRVLVSLKEAHGRLKSECVGGGYLDNPLVGREKELKAIKDFAVASEKRILPIVGAAGIGKSRLIYEAMILLSQEGWRVLWALPEAMSRSSGWFQLLNSNQPTCVVVDDPNDLDLLRAVLEQLAPVERRNWKVIVACRSTQSEILRRFQRLQIFANEMLLDKINERESRQLLTSNCSRTFSDADYLTIFKHTGGVPGWLCLVAELANRDSLGKLPQSVDDIASLYVEDCLSRLDPQKRNDGLSLLRYLALWGTLGFDANLTDQSQANFLAGQGIDDSDLRELLKRFVTAGVVRNWGFGKRLFAIQPMIVREHILSSWLFDGDTRTYQVNIDGKRIIELLVKGKIPAIELALRSISHLTRSRLEPSQGYSFVKPVFDELMVVSQAGSVVDQSQLLNLIEILGGSDPESALDSLKAIREHDKLPVEINDALWGKITFTRKSVLAKLPWLLFQIAAFVRDSTVATRYLEEFRHLLTDEADLGDEIETGKGVQQLLKRLLCESKNAIVFSEPAKTTVLQEIARPASWPFVGILMECLLNPNREYTEWTAQWTLTVARRALIPDGPEWNTATELREKSFNLLRSDPNVSLRAQIWAIIAESHHQFHRLILHKGIQGTTASAYRGVLINDLTVSATVLEDPPIQITVEEAVAARKMWSWYLKYGKEDDLVALARRCEQACESLSKWRLQDFFRFDTSEALAPETERIVALFRGATDTSPFIEFFTAAKTYLDAARPKGDMADSIRITTLADAVFDTFEFSAGAEETQTQVTAYVVAVLGQPQVVNEFAWEFAVRVCQKHLLRIKESKNEDRVLAELKTLIALCPNKGKLLFDMYSNPHPRNTGNLSQGEFECLIANESTFTAQQLFILFGVFAPLNWFAVQPHLNRAISTMRGKSPQIDHCVGALVQMMELTALRYDLHVLGAQIDWILETIMQEDLDGAILGAYALTWMRKQTDYRLRIAQLTRLIRARIELEGKPKTSASFRVFPFEFEVAEWCRLDISLEEDTKAFYEFCSLGLADGYIVFHWLPKFISQLDPSGHLLARFVGQQIDGNPSITSEGLARMGHLASAYSDTSTAWAEIAKPISVKVAALPREERELVYSGLSRKETGVLSSAPGEVPIYYTQIVENATRMRDAETTDSPLREYREWSLRLAQEQLHRQTQMAEEVRNG